MENTSSIDLQVPGLFSYSDIFTLFADFGCTVLWMGHSVDSWIVILKGEPVLDSLVCFCFVCWLHHSQFYSDVCTTGLSYVKANIWHRHDSIGRGIVLKGVSNLVTEPVLSP